MTDPQTVMPGFHRLIRILIDTGRVHLKLVEPERTELRAAYDRVVLGGRTSASWEQWLDEQVEQVAIAWLLGATFVRYAEDNGLIAQTTPMGDAREWWLSRFSTLAAALGAAPGQVAPADSRMMSEHGARLLINFWYENNQGRLAVDLATPDLNTRFFGDLYQDLSEPARRQYALLQTPAFVEEFILDQTLESAVELFKIDELMILDPVCGSGSFLLGAFARLLAHWATATPEMPQVERIRSALAAVNGVDLNPFAVLITRFRLLIAARRACSSTPASKIPATNWPLHIAAGDSLLGEGGELDKYPDLLRKGKYHVVVGNPPYTTVKDSAIDARYRSRYDACTGKYSQTVPFIQRFFELARGGDEERAGYVGLLAANSFTKREFGRKLVEEFLTKRVTLTKLVDTSGAFIPGHGTPTLILVGRNRPNLDSDSVLVVAGSRGEPSAPIDPAEGLVWQSILRHANQAGRTDRWTESLTLNHAALRSFPWQLSGSRAAAVMQLLAGDRQLGEIIARISYLANTGADDIFTAPKGTWIRQRTERVQVIDVVSGSDVRDWTATSTRSGFFPRAKDLRIVDIHNFPGHHRRLWPFRTVLGNRRDFSGRSYFSSNRIWYDWHTVAGAPTAHPPRISFAWVATHPHFATLDNALALPSAPIIELNPQSSPDLRLQLVAYLNSSTVCFWLKQVSNRKGVSSVHKSTRGGGEAWEDTYEYTPGRVRELPVLNDLVTRYSEELDQLARALAASTPTEVLTTGAPTRQRLTEARARWAYLRGRMIALAEEQDWEIYSRFGLLPDPTLATEPADVPSIRAGERAFEIALARKAAKGEDLATQWFTRHGSMPVTETPAHWPSEYRELVEARVSAIATHANLSVLERPEYKRRWTTAGWEMLEQQALREWLLEQCESATLWYETHNDHPHPRVQSITSLCRTLRLDSSVVDAATLYAPDKDFTEVLRELLLEESVPCLAAARYKESGLAKWAGWRSAWQQQRREDQAHSTGDARTAQQIRDGIPIPARYVPADFRRPSYWRMRGKHDVPSERFLLAGDSESGPLLGWSGWTQVDRALALIGLIEDRLAAGRPDRRSLIPLIAAVQEVLEWVDDNDTDLCCTDVRDRARLDGWMDRLGITERDLETWRPASPKRGRPRKQPAIDHGEGS